MKKTVVSGIIIIILIVLFALVFDWGRRGATISESDLNATSTFNYLGNSSSTSDIPIVVNNIKDNQKVLSPIKIEGKAKGNWFFEATFPIQLVDDGGNIIATTTARAETDWATTSFVDFTAELDYIKPTSTTRALIVLSNDNPSGNPDFDQSIFIPVTLK